MICPICMDHPLRPKVRMELKGVGLTSSRYVCPHCGYDEWKQGHSREFQVEANHLLAQRDTTAQREELEARVRRYLVERGVRLHDSVIEGLVKLYAALPVEGLTTGLWSVVVGEGGAFHVRQVQLDDVLPVLSDPGRYVARDMEFTQPRWEGDSYDVEPLHHWQARAVLRALGGALPEQL